jgi:hypothetical protein
MATPRPVPAPEGTAVFAILEGLGAWRSLVARTVRVGEVPGSNPGAPIGLRSRTGRCKRREVRSDAVPMRPRWHDRDGSRLCDSGRVWPVLLPPAATISRVTGEALQHLEVGEALEQRRIDGDRPAAARAPAPLKHCCPQVGPRLGIAPGVHIREVIEHGVAPAARAGLTEVVDPILHGRHMRVSPRSRATPLFAASLDRGDQVALEVSGNAWELARISWAVKRPSSAAGPSPRACSSARRQDRRPDRTL